LNSSALTVLGAKSAFVAHIFNFSFSSFISRHTTMANSRSSYYDIDAILAEEELVPCMTNFDFSYLAHLDPDLHGTNKHVLPVGSRIKLPLWALDKWASLDFVNLNLPRHYQRKAREKLEAAPSEVDLRSVHFVVAALLHRNDSQVSH
jgi:hypothetical protein